MAAARHFEPIQLLINQVNAWSPIPQRGIVGGVEEYRCDEEAGKLFERGQVISSHDQAERS